MTTSLAQFPPPPKRNLLRRVASMALFAVLLGAFATTALTLQHNRLRHTLNYRPYIDRLILPRTEYAKALAFGYDMAVADFLFLRSIQAFGGQWRMGMPDIDSVYHYFHTMTELDPHFLQAYEFGSLIMAEEGNDPELALALNEKGWIHNSHTYKLAYLNAYTAYYTMNDVDRARLWIRLATTAPDCPDFVRRFEYFFDRQGGNFAAALERWVWEYLNAIDRNDSITRQIAENQISIVTNEWNLKTLHRALREYYYDHDQTLPEDLEELARKGYLDEGSGCLYFQLMAELESLAYQPGRALPEMERVVAQWLVPQTGVPYPPYGSYPGEDRYFIRRDAHLSDIEEAVEGEYLIFSQHGARQMLRERLLPYIRRVIEEFYIQHGRNPDPLEEAFVEFGGLRVADPMTGRWDYNPETGELRSPSFPDL